MRDWCVREEYLDGPESSIESIAAGGVTTACAVVEKEPGFPPNIRGDRPRHPADLPGDRAVAHVVLAVHEARVIGWAVTPCELRSHEGVITRLAGDPSELLVDFGWSAPVGQRVALPPRDFLSRLAYPAAASDTREAVARDLTEAQVLLDIAVTPEPAQ